MKSREEISDALGLEEDALFLDDFDDCILGVADGFAMHGVVAYDLHKVIEKLKGQGMSEIEAWEYYSFNMVGAYVGDMTPIYITKLGELDVSDSGDELREDER